MEPVPLSVTPPLTGEVGGNVLRIRGMQPELASSLLLTAPSMTSTKRRTTPALERAVDVSTGEIRCAVRYHHETRQKLPSKEL